jgi:hypothetical protein
LEQLLRAKGCVPCTSTALKGDDGDDEEEEDDDVDERDD